MSQPEARFLNELNSSILSPQDGLIAMEVIIKEARDRIEAGNRDHMFGLLRVSTLAKIVFQYKIETEKQVKALEERIAIMEKARI